MKELYWVVKWGDGGEFVSESATLAQALDRTCEKLYASCQDSCLPEEVSFFFSAVDCQEGNESPQIEVTFSIKERNDETPESGDPAFVNYGFDDTNELALAMFFDSLLLMQN